MRPYSDSSRATSSLYFGVRARMMRWGTTACAFGVQDDDPKGAWNAYQDAQQADPSYLPAFVLGGEACAQSLSWEFATECYNKALALNPRHPEVLQARLGLP